MSTTPLDADRPPEGPRRRRRPGAGRTGRRRRSIDRLGSTDGGREQAVVEDITIDPYDSYYGRPVVKAPPWRAPIAVYLFLGGLAGGSGILATGAQLTGRPMLRRTARLTALGALGVGTVALIEDLGRPERFLNMMRTLKISSPMSVGTWILGSFGAVSGVVGAIEVDRMTGERIPLGPLRPLVHGAETPAALAQAALGPLLASYTGALLGDTAVPTWAAGRKHLSALFVSSATLATGGAAMLTAPVSETRPARLLAVAGVAGDVASLHAMKASMHPLEAEPLETGRPGTMLRWAERLAVAGAVGTVLGGRHRAVAAVSGAALLAASALTRFGVLEAGLESVKDPRRVIEPQKARLAARRDAGITDDSITTVG
ncbi:MAG: NrfD/PsrC family molybdoenzyme membrane anchor subunit [Brachybacterium tyrofermentans]|uniref:NrfD/PsrC family molybdoenzyme membrane anchor subunit n=1 Tax=Brachybacterium tyrofermentans TaxID=47848 RepID=UPI003FB88F46